MGTRINICHVISKLRLENHICRVIFSRAKSLVWLFSLKTSIWANHNLPFPPKIPGRKIMNSSPLIENRGQLIVFEGLDKSGKSTQSQKLKEALEKDGQLVDLWSFPDRNTKLGDVIDSYLNKKLELHDRSIHLLFSANRWEKVSKLIKLLESGTTVITDRYAFSGVAYSAAKGLPLEWCKQPDVGLPKPDCVIFLQLSPEAGAKRNGFGEERYEKTQFQNKVLEQFMQIKDESWKIINADQNMEDLHQEIYKHIKSLKNEELNRLWEKKD